MIFSTVNLIFVFPPIFICICMLCFIYVSCKIYMDSYTFLVFVPQIASIKLVICLINLRNSRPRKYMKKKIQ